MFMLDSFHPCQQITQFCRLNPLFNRLNTRDLSTIAWSQSRKESIPFQRPSRFCQLKLMQQLSKSLPILLRLGRDIQKYM